MEAQANLPSRPVGKGGRVGLVGRARAAEVRVAVAGGLAEVEGDQDGGRVIRSELHARPIREAGTGGDFDLPHGPFGTGASYSRSCCVAKESCGPVPGESSVRIGLVRSAQISSEESPL